MTIVSSPAPSFVMCFPWLQRALWLTLPFSAGGIVGDALGERCRGVQLAGSGLAWAGWAVGLVALVVAHPLSCTALRSLAPVGALGTLWAAFIGDASSRTVTVGVATALAGALMAMSAAFGERCVNGPAYPNEHRFLLRPAGPLLLGPIELAWAFAIAGVALGPLLIGAGNIVLGAPAVVLGPAIAVMAFRSLHGLSRRFVVFVPAGFVLHDPSALREPVLFPKNRIETMRLAPAGSESLDLTLDAPGLAIEVLLREKSAITLLDPRRRTAVPGATAQFLFAPTRPGRVLAEAVLRRLVP